MAQRIQVILEDDVDGSAAAETVSFALDGATYEIDLSDKNAEKLREALAPWIGHARRSGGSARRRTSSRSRNSANNDIRAWAAEQGMKVAPRGRISAEVRQAYENRNA